MQGVRRRSGFLTASLLAFAAAALADPANTPEKGCFLVAREDLGDPNFYQTVVLVLDYDERGAMGVVVNRPTPVSIGDLLPKLKQADGNVYLGGPVERGGVVLVVRARNPLDGFERVTADLQTGANIEAVLNMPAKGSAADSLRVYAGYAGWGPGQLDYEIEQGSWLIVKPAVEPVFDPRPEGLWRKMLDGASLRFAHLGETLDHICHGRSFTRMGCH